MVHWLDVTDWFVQRAHDSGRVDSDCGEDELVARFELFERSLSSLVGSFFEAVEELDAILENANA